jgi:hypothetical protein
MHGQQDFLHHVFDIVRPMVLPFAQQRPQMSGQVLQKQAIRRGVTFQRADQQGSGPLLDWTQRSGVRLVRHVDRTPSFDSGRARSWLSHPSTENGPDPPKISAARHAR